MPARLSQLVPGRSRVAPRAELEVPEVPEGWVTGPPDFVIVGAQKAGTTRWRYLLNRHPRIHCQPQELRWFDRFTDTWPGEADIASYHRFFPKPPGDVSGEKSPSYAGTFWVPPMLRQAAPDARVILIVRDPIERYQSARAFAERHRERNAAQGISHAAYTRRVMDTAFHQGKYAEQVEAYLRAFPPEQFLVLQFEACNKDPVTELERTFRFLGVDPIEIPQDALDRRVNVSQWPRIPLEPERRQVLVDRYRPDVERLVSLVPTLDLSLWPSYAGDASGPGARG
jgi:hypothetical protein